MKKSIISFAALAILFACSEKKSMEPSVDRMVSIVASTTKTTLSENSVRWSDGDEVAVCFKGDQVDAYRAVFTSASAGSVTSVFNTTLPNSVTVAGGYGKTAYAVYPADKMGDDGTVTFDLPAQQKATETGSFESGLNLSSAVVSLEDLDADGTTNALFMNAFSIIRFTLDADMKEVVITADAPLAGNAPMTFVEEGDNIGRLVTGTPVNSSNSVTLTPAGDTFDEEITYNVLVYPGTFATLGVKLTDKDNVVYERSLTAGGYTFVASKYYTFNFNTNYVKEYTFTATGREFAVGDQIATVFSNAASEVVQEEVLAAAIVDSKAQFTGKLTKLVVSGGDDITGFAVYPADAYAAAADNISYVLPADGKTDVDELYSALLTPASTEVNFNSVESALAEVMFEVPAGITAVKIASDQGFVGTSVMTVDAQGGLVAGVGDGMEINIASANAGSYALRIYPVDNAKFTVTLTNESGDEKSQDFTGMTAAAGAGCTIDLSGIAFDKSGGFTNEDFTEGEGNFDFN